MNLVNKVKCECADCIRRREEYPIIESINSKLNPEELAFFNKLQNDRMHLEDDLNYLECIIDGSWPSADEIIENARNKRAKLDTDPNYENKGFQIYIQNNLNEEEKVEALNYSNKFISLTVSDPHFRYLGNNTGGYTTGLWRGRFGITIGSGLVFRRISKNLRKFAVVRANTLEVFDDKPLNKYHHWEKNKDGELPNCCVCPTHKGAIKVRFKEYVDMSLYATIGQYKG